MLMNWTCYYPGRTPRGPPPSYFGGLIVTPIEFLVERRLTIAICWCQSIIYPTTLDEIYETPKLLKTTQKKENWSYEAPFKQGKAYFDAWCPNRGVGGPIYTCFPIFAPNFWGH